MHRDKYTDIVIEYCNNFQEIPSRSLAKLILKHHPECKHTIDQMRSRVRVRRGSMGQRLREKIHSQIPQKTGYILPAMHKKREMYNLIQTGHVLYIGDVHVPFHDVDAIRLMLDWCDKNYKINAVVYTGDFLDCISISKFAKMGEYPSMQEEIEYGEDILDFFQDAFPKAKHIWKDGNHEMRLPRYVASNAPELQDVIKLGAGDLLNVTKRRMDYVGALQLIKAGKLTVCHGHEVGINSVGVNPARSLYLKTHDTALCFHLHNSSSHTDKTIRGKFPTCWSGGCLCDLSPDYRPYGNRYNLGFVVQELDKSGDFLLENLRIIDNKVVRS